MVSFSCDQCADVIKKPQLDNHKERCRNNSFTCLDCSETFEGAEYRSHTSCITEKEKFQKGDSKGKKQEQSLEKSKSTPTESKQKQNIGNDSVVGQELSPKKNKDSINRKSEDATRKKDQDKKNKDAAHKKDQDKKNKDITQKKGQEKKDKDVISKKDQEKKNKDMIKKDRDVTSKEDPKKSQEKKNKDVIKKDQDVNSKENPKKSQEQASIGDAKQLEKKENEIHNNSKKSKSKKKNAVNGEVKAERKDKVENKAELGNVSTTIEGTIKALAKVSKKRKAGEQLHTKSNPEEKKQPGTQIKDSSAQKIEIGVQKSKKKKLEPQHPTTSGSENDNKSKESLAKTQNFGDQSASKNQNSSEKKKKQKKPVESALNPPNSQEADKSPSKSDLSSASVAKIDKSLKRKNEQVVESSSPEGEKKQKIQAAEISSDKKNDNVKSKKKKKNKGTVKDNGIAKSNELDFKSSATETVKQIFKEGKHHEMTLQQLEKMVVDQFTADPKNKLDSDELHQKFKENITFVFKDGNVTLK